ncbi:MAG TPA: nucleotidyltransferase domain-containing protein [Candidatus Saccharimonadales bacterium]|jgi:predicted nucleotidyltransferase
MAVQLEQKYLNELLTIVRAHVDVRTWRPVIFGSRARGTAQRFSDVDLGFVGSQPLPQKMKTELWEALDDSDIPYVIDIVDLSSVSPELRELAGKEMVQLA